VAGVKAMRRRWIWAVVFGAMAASAHAQSNPGLSAQPAGRSLADPTATPMEKPVDLLRPNPVQITNENNFAENPLYAPEFEDKPWAQALLGSRYVRSSESGDQVSKGLELLNTAAQQGEPTAQYELATIYAEGLAVPPDADAAIDWARKAAQGGNIAAQHTAGLYLLRRAATPQDIKEGLDFLEKAAAQNHREALMVLAGILTRGEFGLAKDQKRAEGLLLPRAKEGDLEFQFGLATLYLYGDQFAEAKDTGMSWLRRSADGGHEKSKELLAKIAGETAAPAE
jgi:TPR repeat protein